MSQKVKKLFWSKKQLVDSKQWDLNAGNGAKVTTSMENTKRKQTQAPPGMAAASSWKQQQEQTLSTLTSKESGMRPRSPSLAFLSDQLVVLAAEADSIEGEGEGSAFAFLTTNSGG